MSKQRTCKLVTKILMKTCSSLVKMISDGVNNFIMQNKYKKVDEVKKRITQSQKCSYGIIYISFTWCRPDRHKNSRLIVKTDFYII